MSEVITLEVSPAVKSRIDFVCTELNITSSEAVAEAFDAYFRKLITDGKINADMSLVSSGGDEKPETNYTLDGSQPKNGSLTQKEINALGKTQRKNYDKALQGDAKALNVMGTYFETGNPFGKDPVRAVYWYTLAAEKGNSNAQYHLAVLCNKVEANPLKAYYWFELAKLCGFNVTPIHQDYMLRLAEMLSPRQIKLAHDEAVRKYERIQQEA